MLSGGGNTMARTAVLRFAFGLGIFLALLFVRPFPVGAETQTSSLAAGAARSPLQTPGVSTDGEVDALAVQGNNVYVGGTFTHAGGVPVNSIAKWNGTQWSALGSGVDGPVETLLVVGSQVFAGGGFTHAGGVNANHIAVWNGSKWSALGSGMSGSGAHVAALAYDNGILYAAGHFAKTGNSSADSIAAWNGSQWSALGSGVGTGDPNAAAEVIALAVHNHIVYVGGYFFFAGGAGANYIAQWNGAKWSALGSGSNGPVRALTFHSTKLYILGGDITGGKTSPSTVAIWDGNTWSALSTSSNSAIGAEGPTQLVFVGNTLVVGGEFQDAGGKSIANVASWNGHQWTGVGGGVDGTIFAMAMQGNNLFVAGSFIHAGGVTANSVARWNGTTWFALGH
jgi:trimeric autotransporter adhesin